MDVEVSSLKKMTENCSLDYLESSVLHLSQLPSVLVLQHPVCSSYSCLILTQCHNEYDHGREQYIFPVYLGSLSLHWGIPLILEYCFDVNFHNTSAGSITSAWFNVSSPESAVETVSLEPRILKIRVRFYRKRLSKALPSGFAPLAVPPMGRGP